MNRLVAPTPSQSQAGKNLPPCPRMSMGAYNIIDSTHVIHSDPSEDDVSSHGSWSKFDWVCGWNKMKLFYLIQYQLQDSKEMSVSQCRCRTVSPMQEERTWPETDPDDTMGYKYPWLSVLSPMITNDYAMVLQRGRHKNNPPNIDPYLYQSDDRFTDLKQHQSRYY
jgi:hypothetical protein